MISNERQMIAPPCVGNGCIVVYAWNVFDSAEKIAFRSREGWSIRDLAPKTEQPIICLFNGEPILRDDWDYVPTSADHLYFQTLPSGPLLPYAWYILAAVAIVAVAFMARPDLQTGAQQQESSPTYSFGVSGNQARLGQSIPVPYGRHILTPDFAANPYVEYDENGDEYYHALFCLGMVNKFTLEQIAIDDTNIEHFENIETQFVGPNFSTPLSLVNAAVVTAPEVSQNDLEYGVNNGPFSVCGHGLEVNKIGIDVICPKGLYFAESDGSFSSKSVTWIAEARKISASGAAIGGWSLLGLETLTGSTNTPIRRTYTYNVSAGRYEVRLRRESTRDDNSRVGHDIQWMNLRGYLTTVPTLEENATFLAIKAKANNQLSSQSERRFTVIIRRWLPTWHPDTGWSEETETRSIAWAAADVLRNAVYGGKLGDTRIDLESLYELALLWESRGDYFDGVFDTRTTVWAALQTVLRVGRAKPIMRGNVITFVRDQEQTLPVALFNMRNIERGSFTIEYSTVQEDANDGIEIEFVNSDKWSSDWVTLPLPGYADGYEPVNPAKTMLKGITERNHALRECAYMAAVQAYRNVSVQLTTEMEGLSSSYGELIAVAHDLAEWGVSGEIESWDGLTAVCSEELIWGEGDHYAVLTDSFGDLHGPFKVVHGILPRSMQFVELPSFDPYTGLEKERCRFSMGEATNFAKYCVISDLSPQANGKVQIKAFVENSLVHTADLPYTGSGGVGTGGGIFRVSADDTPPFGLASPSDLANYGFLSEDDGFMPDGETQYVLE